jgi:hypothetical protein
MIYGFTLAYHVFWFAPLFGMGLACFGLQVIATTCYTHSIDSYRAESSETPQLFNFIRQEFGMTYAFYVVKLCKKIGYQWAFFLLTIFNVLVFLPMVLLMFKGTEWRKTLGTPKNINALDADYEGPVEMYKLAEEKKLERR